MAVIKSKAYTLIELLVVIAIISIIASLIAVNLSSMKQSAKNAKIISQAYSMAISIRIATYNNESIVPDSMDWSVLTTDDSGESDGFSVSDPAFGIDTVPNYSDDPSEVYYYIKSDNSNPKNIFIWAPLNGAVDNYNEDTEGVCYKNGNRQGTQIKIESCN